MYVCIHGGYFPPVTLSSAFRASKAMRSCCFGASEASGHRCGAFRCPGRVARVARVDDGWRTMVAPFLPKKEGVPSGKL